MKNKTNHNKIGKRCTKCGASLYVKTTTYTCNHCGSKLVNKKGESNEN